MSPVSAFPRSGFLATASDDLARLLSDLATEVDVAEDAVLLEQGEEGDALYAIIDGALEFSILSPDGRKLSLDVMTSGALFGEIALFDPGPRTATATAIQPSRVWAVKNADVLAAVRESPELAIDLIRLAGQRMRWMNTQLNDQVFLPLSTRVARKVLHLVRDDNSAQPHLPLSQAEVADFVGATREAVSKTLSNWRKSGVIEPGRGGLTILDRPALQTIADLNAI
jgi:CRP-like cAMP-binding protein